MKNNYLEHHQKVLPPSTDLNNNNNNDKSKDHEINTRIFDKLSDAHSNLCQNHKSLLFY